MASSDKFFGKQVDFAINTVNQLFPSGIAKKIKKARIKKGLSRKELVRISKNVDESGEGIDSLLFLMIERGIEKRPPKRVKDILSKILDIQL